MSLHYYLAALARFQDNQTPKTNQERRKTLKKLQNSLHASWLSELDCQSSAVRVCQSIDQNYFGIFATRRMDCKRRLIRVQI